MIHFSFIKYKQPQQNSDSLDERTVWDSERYLFLCTLNTLILIVMAGMVLLLANMKTIEVDNIRATYALPSLDNGKSFGAMFLSFSLPGKNRFVYNSSPLTVRIGRLSSPPITANVKEIKSKGDVTDLTIEIDSIQAAKINHDYLSESSKPHGSVHISVSGETFAHLLFNNNLFQHKN